MSNKFQPTITTSNPPTSPTPPLHPAPPTTILDIWEEQRHHASHNPRRTRIHRPAPHPSTRTHRLRTALTTATARATLHTAQNTAYAALRALDAWAHQHCACPSSTHFTSTAPDRAAIAASNHHDAASDHAALIAHAIRRGMAEGLVWDWDEEDEEDENDDDVDGARVWFRAVAVSAGRLAQVTGDVDGARELAGLGARVRRAVVAVVRAMEGVRDEEGEEVESVGGREAEEAFARVLMLGGVEEEEVRGEEMRVQAEMMRVPVAYEVAVGGLDGWVKRMEKWYKSILREVRGVYAEIAERDGNVLAQSFAEALDGSAVLVADRLMKALGWTQADLDAGVSTINSATCQGCPGSPWHQLIITSIPHIGRMLRDLHFAVYRLSHPTTQDGSWKDAAPVLAKLKHSLDRYHAWTMANFDRIHVVLCARLAEMQADPIYYNDPLHATVRSAFKSTTGLFVSPRVKPLLPLGVNQNCFASVLRQLEPQLATLSPRLRADYDMMRSVFFFYNLGIEAKQKRAQCDNDFALVPPEALVAHGECAVRTAMARWEEIDAKYAEALDAAVESAEQLDAYSIAARDALAALRDGESLERAAELATFGNLYGPEGRFVVPLLRCAINWRNRADAAKAHVQRCERFHTLWSQPRRSM